MGLFLTQFGIQRQLQNSAQLDYTDLTKLEGIRGVLWRDKEKTTIRILVNPQTLNPEKMKDYLEQLLTNQSVIISEIGFFGANQLAIDITPKTKTIITPTDLSNAVIAGYASFMREPNEVDNKRDLTCTNEIAKRSNVTNYILGGLYNTSGNIVTNLINNVNNIRSIVLPSKLPPEIITEIDNNKEAITKYLKNLKGTEPDKGELKKILIKSILNQQLSQENEINFEAANYAPLLVRKNNNWPEFEKEYGALLASLDDIGNPGTKYKNNDEIKKIEKFKEGYDALIEKWGMTPVMIYNSGKLRGYQNLDSYEERAVYYNNWYSMLETYEKSLNDKETYSVSKFFTKTNTKENYVVGFDYNYWVPDNKTFLEKTTAPSRNLSESLEARSVYTASLFLAEHTDYFAGAAYYASIKTPSATPSKSDCNGMSALFADLITKVENNSFHDLKLCEYNITDDKTGEVKGHANIGFADNVNFESTITSFYNPSKTKYNPSPAVGEVPILTKPLSYLIYIQLGDREITETSGAISTNKINDDTLLKAAKLKVILTDSEDANLNKSLNDSYYPCVENMLEEAKKIPDDKERFEEFYRIYKIGLRSQIIFDVKATFMHHSCYQEDFERRYYIETEGAPTKPLQDKLRKYDTNNNSTIDFYELEDELDIKIPYIPSMDMTGSHSEREKNDPLHVWSQLNKELEGQFTKEEKTEFQQLKSTFLTKGKIYLSRE